MNTRMLGFGNTTFDRFARLLDFPGWYAVHDVSAQEPDSWILATLFVFEGSLTLTNHLGPVPFSYLADMWSIEPDWTDAYVRPDV